MKETNKATTKSIVNIISKERKEEVTNLLRVLRAVRDDKPIAENDLSGVLKKIGFCPYEISKSILSTQIVPRSQYLGIAGLRKIPIKATTIQSSKGLDADYVFITHFDDRYFINDKNKKKISDRDICNFLVALTRAKMRVFLISSDSTREPTFLKWINKDRIEKRV